MSENAKEAILEAARRTAQAHGYGGLNFREIGAEVGIKAASIHYHFPSKADLGAAVARRYWEDTAAALEAMLAEIPAEDTSDNRELRRDLQHALDELDQPAPPYDPTPFDIMAEYPARELPAFEVLSEAERLQLLQSPEADTRAGASSRRAPGGE